MMSLLFSTIQSSVFTLLQKSREGVFCEIWLNVDVSEKNPFGAKCIFCKSAMITFDNIAPHISRNSASLALRK